MQANREDAHQQQQAPEKNNTNLFVIGGVALAVLVGLGWYFTQSDESPQIQQPQPTEVAQLPEPAVQPEPVETTAEITEQPELPETETVQPEVPEIQLPALDDSDSEVLQGILALTPLSSLADVLINQDIIRRFVIFTDNLANQQIATKHHLLKTPRGEFSVDREGDVISISPESTSRYDLYTEIFISMNVSDAVRLYEQYLPLINEVYAEIGYPDQNFRDTLISAIDHILATPLPEDMTLEQPSVMYKFTDPRVEALSDVQKQLLRMGEKNLKQVKNKLRTFKRALASYE